MREQIKTLASPRCIRYVIVPHPRVEIEVERAGEENLNLHHVMDVPCL
jgi:hypothetical protein